MPDPCSGSYGQYRIKLIQPWASRGDKTELDKLDNPEILPNEELKCDFFICCISLYM